MWCGFEGLWDMAPQAPLPSTSVMMSVIDCINDDLLLSELFAHGFQHQIDYWIIYELIKRRENYERNSS